MTIRLSKVFIFAAGAIAGSVVTRCIIKDKYRRMAEEEIASVKERFTVKRLKPKFNKEEDNEGAAHEEQSKREVPHRPVRITRDKAETEEEDISDVEKLVRDYDYNPGVYDEEPIILEPGEFGALDNFEMVSYTYYQGNDVMTDDKGHVLSKDIMEDVIGYDAYDLLDDDAVDVVYVRNNDLMTDFEIFKEPGNYIDKRGGASIV